MKNRFSGFIKNTVREIADNKYIYLLILLSVICFWTPYIAKGFPDGGEIRFHYARIMTLADSLEVGIFPAKVRPTHLKLFGYGIGFFYPDLLLYPPAFLIAHGADYEITVKIWEFFILVIGGMITYRCFRKLTGKKELALIGEILFMESGLNDNNFFNGGGMPHMFAYMFVPLAICGLLRALKDDDTLGYVEFAAGMILVLLTHNMIFLILMFTMLIILICHVHVIVRNIKILGKLIAAGLVSMVLTTAYWLPAMEQILHIKFIAFFDNAYTVSEHILAYKDLISEFTFFYSILFAASVVMYFVMLFKRRRMPADITSLLITNIFLMWFMCSKALWTSSIGDALNFFEYTNRFTFVVTVTVLMFIIMTLREIWDTFELPDLMQKRNTAAGLLVFCAVLILFTRVLVRPDFLKLQTDNRLFLTKQLLMDEFLVSGAEWVPVETEPTECKQPYQARSEDWAEPEGNKLENAKYFEVWVNLDKQYYDMPYVYYYGYRAYLLDENNDPVSELEVGEAFDDNGYVRVFMPENGEGVGHILTTYRKTTVQKISYLISALAAAALIVLFILRSFRSPQGDPAGSGKSI